MSERYKAQREHGTDWCVIDLRSPGNPEVVTGLSDQEAHDTADEWNKEKPKEK